MLDSSLPRYTFFLLFFLYTGCFTDMYLIRTLDNIEKADALTRKGIYDYEFYLNTKNDFSSVPGIVRHFEQALKFDRNNTQAKQYLDRVESFRSNYIEKYVSLSLKYKNIVDISTKSGRKPQLQTEFNMLFYLQQALDLDPKNAQAKEIFNQTADSRKRVVTQYIIDGKKYRANFESSKKSTDKDSHAQAGYRRFRMAEMLDNKNQEAKNGAAFFQKYLNDRFNAYHSHALKLLNGKKFSSAESAVKKMGNFADSLKQETVIELLFHQLYYRWAEYSFKTADYAAASEKISAALTYSRDRQTLYLQSSIAAKRREEQLSRNFERTLSELREAIERKDLYSAKTRIEDLIGEASPAQRRKLQELLNKIDAALNLRIDSIYNDAVQAFRAEDFEEAIRLFEEVKKINAGYKDTQSYFDKATEKKKLLDSF